MEEFFKGGTRSGRTLVLYYEHTAFDTFVDETGETFANPSETKITGTLDGAPIDVQAVNWSSNGTATVRSDLGTFTATATDYEEDHSEALRRYLEHRPPEGYEVTIVDKGQVGEEASYTVTITNGKLTERVEFRLSHQVMRTLSGGADAPSDEQVRHEITQQVSRDSWSKIKDRAENPTTLIWLAHPSSETVDLGCPTGDFYAALSAGVRAPAACAPVGIGSYLSAFPLGLGPQPLSAARADSVRSYEDGAK